MDSCHDIMKKPDLVKILNVVWRGGGVDSKAYSCNNGVLDMSDVDTSEQRHPRVQYYQLKRAALFFNGN